MRTTHKNWQSLLPPVFLGVSQMAVYLRTIAPGLTWLHNGADGGDLIAAAATGGIPHPTGYPLYLLVARLFQFLPFGSLAFRTNLMSAIFSALASIMIYLIVVRYLEGGKVPTIMLAGLAAGYGFGMAPLVWSQVVITEVYTLQAFLLATVIYLYSCTVWQSAASQKNGWHGLALGLSLTNHMTSLLFVPAALLIGATRRRVPDTNLVGHDHRWLRRYWFDIRPLGWQLVWLTVGLCLYLTLPLRAVFHPPINWGNPVTFARLWWIVSGKLYQDVFLHFNASYLWQLLLVSLHDTIAQMGILISFIGLFAVLRFGKFSRLAALTVWVAITSLAFVMVYRPADGEVYLIPILISISIWFGIGTGRIAGQLLERSSALGIAVSLAMLAVVLVRPVSYFPQVDASQDKTAESFGREVLSTAPQNALLFVEGDQALFALWYFHLALHRRTDVAVLATDLLPYDWYQENLRFTYPNLLIPDSFGWPDTIIRANRLRPVCYVQYTDRTAIQCSRVLPDP